MKFKKVKELALPLSEYVTVKEDDTLGKAMEMLLGSQKKHSEEYNYKHQAVLVYDKNGEISGKVSALDVLRALEPKYSQFGRVDQLGKLGLSRFGLSNKFIGSMLDHYNLWNENSEILAKKAKNLKVKTIMHSLGEGEYVDENDNIAEAIHQLILGHHQSLLVLRDEKVVGILKLSDVFKLICDFIVK